MGKRPTGPGQHHAAGQVVERDVTSALRDAMFVAAGLPLGSVSAPDERFADARRQLGPAHPAVLAAVAARNALAATAEPIVRSMAAAYSNALPHVDRDEAAQAGRLGAMRAAELFDPARGASFATYSRAWIRKYIGRHADRALAVHPGERARLAGERTWIGELDPELPDVAEDDTDPRLDALDRALDALAPRAREIIELAHGIGVGRDPVPADDAAAHLGMDPADFRRELRRAHAQLHADLAGQPRQLGLL